MECPSHKGVILWRIAEYHQLGRSNAVPVSGQPRRLADHFAHYPDRVHVDPGLGGADVHRRADKFRLCQRPRNGFDQFFIPCGKSFVYQSRIAADKVDPYFLCRPVQSQGVFYRISPGGRHQHGDRRYRNALVDDRDSVFRLNLLSHLHQVFGVGGDFVVHFLTGAVDVRVTAGQKRNPHRNGPDIQMLLFDHLDRFHNILHVNHGHALP